MGLSKALRWLEGWIIGICTMIMIVLGLGLAGQVHLGGGADSGSFAFQHPVGIVVIGWSILGLAVAILIATMAGKDGTPSRWVKALPGLLVIAAFNSLLSLVNGHGTNLPSKPISHRDALTMMFLFLGSAVLLAVTFKGRNINFVDRLMLVAFVISVGWSMLADSAIGLAFGICCLLLAWVFNRIKSRGHSSGRSEFPAT